MNHIETSAWISVSESLPKTLTYGLSERVLVFMNLDDKQFIAIDRYSALGRFTGYGNFNVTHWQSLPLPPEVCDESH